MDQSLAPLELNGSLFGKVVFHEDWNFQWEGSGQKISWENQNLKSWMTNGTFDQGVINFDFSSRDPEVHDLNGQIALKEEVVHFTWNWDESTDWLQGMGLPSTGSVVGDFSWANGGYAHLENSENGGFSPLFADWHSNGTTHELDVRIGDYFLQAVSDKSPMDWEFNSLEWDAAALLNSWLSGQFRWLKNQGLRSLSVDMPDLSIAYRFNRDSQRITVLGNMEEKEFVIESTSPLGGTRPVETFATYLTDGLRCQLRWFSKSVGVDQVFIETQSSAWDIASQVGMNLDRQGSQWNAKLLPSSVMIAGKESRFEDGQYISWDWNHQKLNLQDGIKLKSSAGELKLDGAISSKGHEVLTAEMSNFQLDFWMNALGAPEMPVQGDLWGVLNLVGTDGDWNAEGYLWIPEIQIDTFSLGTFESQWTRDSETGKFNMQAVAGWPGQDSIWLEAAGEKSPLWDFDVTIDRFPLRSLAILSQDVLDDLEGFFNAELVIRDKGDGLKPHGRGTLEELAFSIPVTGVRYSGNTKLNFREEDIRIQGEMWDVGDHGTVQLAGRMDFNQWNGNLLDLSFNSERFQALDLESGEDFYGSVQAFGSGRLLGGFAGMQLDVEATPLDSSYH